MMKMTTMFTDHLKTNVGDMMIVSECSSFRCMEMNEWNVMRDDGDEDDGDGDDDGDDGGGGDDDGDEGDDDVVDFDEDDENA
jgi:hypothetical protein